MAPAAEAFWTVAPGQGEIRPVELPEPGGDDVVVRTLWSGISRGTESIVFAGRVPTDQRDRMRAPFQDGALPGPVKYGYLNVGLVEYGPSALVGRTVFCLYPHQSRYVVPAAAVSIVPAGVPDRRALLTGPVETAINAVWDGQPVVGDRVAVVGAGIIGSCVARLVGRIPGVRGQLVDIDPGAAATAAALDVSFAEPAAASGDCDVVFHASASPTGLATALSLLGDDGVLVELSWYGAGEVPVALGGSFHSRRLSIRSSQVGAVARVRRHRYSPAQRRGLALQLLADDAYDALLAGPFPFRQLPDLLGEIAAGRGPRLCPTITYVGR
jgi:threonine dehydrogenase-like Zn-dependent dehydrogenase